MLKYLLIPTIHAHTCISRPGLLKWLLGLIRRIFQNTRVVQAKKLLYLTLVRSKLQYCSPIWCPQFINDIKNIENIQRRATKFILNDYSSDYKSQLIKWNLLPLMIQFEINDIMYFVKNLRDPSQSFNVMDFVEFCSGSTRSSTFLKLKQRLSKLNSVKHFYFNRLPRLWKSLRSMDPNDPLSATKQKFKVSVL